MASNETLSHGGHDRRVALVTGGGTGIGFGIASAFGESGTPVMLVGRRAARLRAAADRLVARGQTAAYAVHDVSTEEGCRGAVESATARFGRLDILSLNAGLMRYAPLDHITTDHLAEVFGTNLYGVAHMIHASHSQLAQSGAGRVVVTSSITGPLTGMPSSSVYGASKAAQLGLIRGLALELAPQGITVNAVLPGKIRVESTEEQSADYIAAAVKRIPVGRLGAPSDVAAAVLFLSSPQAAFITGQSIVVDGDQTLPEVTPSATPNE